MTAAVVTGAVLSILIDAVVTVVDRPALFVAVQVAVTPLVSAERTVGAQVVRMPDCASVTVQLTVTLLVYQPLLPAVPARL